MHPQSRLSLPLRLTAAALAGLSPVGLPLQSELLFDVQPQKLGSGFTGSSPEFVALLGSGFLFDASTFGLGRELWYSDGTEAGTRLLFDAVFGTLSGAPTSSVTLPDGSLLTTQSTTFWGDELFRVDPATQKVELVKDLVPGQLGGNARNLTLWNGVAYFLANTQDMCDELWRSDGTEAGTYLVHKFLFDPPSLFNFSTTRIEAATSDSLFVVNTTSSQRLFAFSSEVAPPIFLLSGSVPGPQTFNSVGALGNQLLFDHEAPGLGNELWVSDGTVAGTQLLVDLQPGPSGSFPTPMGATSGRVWFQAGTLSAGREIFFTDGTAGGTIAVPEIAPGSTSTVFSSNASLATQDGLYFATSNLGASGEVFFAPNSGVLPTELFGGTADGDFIEHQGQVYITVFNPLQPDQRGLLRSDGTVSGTRLLQFPEVDSLLALGSTPLGIFLQAGDNQAGVEPWLFDASTETIALVSDLQDPAFGVGSNPQAGIEFNGSSYFAVNGTGPGQGVWRTDGTPAGTQMALNLPSVSGSEFTPWLALSDRFLFSMRTLASGVELWTSPGLSGEFNLLADLQPGAGSIAVREAEIVGTAGYLSIQVDPNSGDELWRTDGTPAGTVPVGLGVPAGPGVEIRELTAFEGQLYFVLDGSSFGAELWRTDDSPAGFSMVADLMPGTLGSNPRELTVAGSALFFAAETAGLGLELFRVDPGGQPTLVADLRAGSDGSSPEQLVALGDLLFFAADDGITFEEPWITDGTTSGTLQLGDLTANTGESFVSRATCAGDRVFFFTRDSSADFKLWSTAGTPGTTTLIADETTPGDDLESQPITALGSGTSILFNSYQSDLGIEVWHATDEPGSVTLAADVNPGAALSVPGNFLRVGGSITFAANDGTNGFEPHAISIVAQGGYVSEPFGFPCGTARIGAEGEVRLGSAFDVTLDAEPASVAGLFLFAELGLTPLAPNCFSLLGGSAVSVGTATTDALGSAAKTLPLGTQPSLLGLPLYFQWVSFQSGGPLLGLLEVSDGLEIWIGS